MTLSWLLSGGGGGCGGVTGPVSVGAGWVGVTCGLSSEVRIRRGAGAGGAGVVGVARRCSHTYRRNN